MINIDKVGAIGQVRDRQPYQIPPQAWTLIKNGVCNHGSAQRILGQEEVFAGASIDPYWLLPWPTSTEFRWIYAGQDDIYYVTGSTHTKITRAAGVYDPVSATGIYTGGVNNLWNGVLLGLVPVLNNGVDDPQSWDTATLKLVDLPNWPATTKCKVMRGFKQFLIALDITEGASRFPYKVWWSDLADPGTVPTTWNRADASALAGDTELADTPGFLIDGEALGDTFFIYKEDSVWAMQFIGGVFVFKFSPVFRDFGILAQRCVKEFEGQHFVVTQSDVKVHNGQSHRSVINEQDRIALFNDIDPANRDKVFVAHHRAHSEMWICYPNSNATAGIPNQAAVWNWDAQTWGHRDLPDVPHIGTGLISEGTSSPFINDVSTLIDNDTSIIDGIRFSATEVKMLATSRAAQKFYQMNLTNTFDGTVFTTKFEREGLAIAGQGADGALQVDPTLQKFIRSVYPKVEVATGAIVNVYVGSQNRVEEAVTWYGPFAFKPSSGQIKIDCRVNGKLISVRFESTGDTSFEMTGYHLDMEIIGAPWPA